MMEKKSLSGPVFTKHLRAKSSSYLGDLRETLKNNGHVSSKLRTPKFLVHKCFTMHSGAKASPLTCEKLILIHINVLLLEKLAPPFSRVL